MNKLKQWRAVKRIGVSNFYASHLTKLSQNSVLGTMYLIPDGIRYFFFFGIRYIVLDIGKYEFSVLGAMYLIPKFFIRCNVPNTEILSLHLHSNWNRFGC